MIRKWLLYDYDLKELATPQVYDTIEAAQEDGDELSNVLAIPLDLPEKPARKFARVVWTAQDVIDMAEQSGLADLSVDEAEEFLENNQGQLQSDMIERGHQSLETLLHAAYFQSEEETP